MTDVGFIGKTKRLVSYLKETVTIEEGQIYKIEKAGTLWTDLSWSSVKLEGNVDFGAGKKPEELIQRIVESSTNTADVVMDFHLGSGTTAAAAHKMGRKYIGVEQMDYIEDVSIERLKKVLEGEQGGISKDIGWQGGGSFVYCELKENAQELIDIIQNANEDNIFSIKNEIYNDKRIVPYLTSKELAEADKEFEALPFEDKKKALVKLIDKNKLYVNYSDIDNEDFDISEDEKKFTRSFYEVGLDE